MLKLYHQTALNLVAQRRTDERGATYNDTGRIQINVNVAKPETFTPCDRDTLVTKGNFRTDIEGTVCDDVNRTHLAQR
jgi:hypothetical protein